MARAVHVSGLRDLARTLEGMTKATAKAALRRALKQSAEPLAAAMREAAPRGATAEDTLAPSIAVSTKLSARQKRLHKRMYRNDKAAVEMFVGAGPDPAAHNQEFGNAHHAPQPFARPAWDAGKDALLERLKDNLATEIDKTAKRIAAKAGKGK